MVNNKVLVIGLTWPEPSTTAAGVRMLQLLQLLKENDYHITFVSAASTTPYSYDLELENINTDIIELNKSSFNTFIEELNPAVVLFDRFITEEHYGWRVAQSCPDAIRILDTEDLHCLREARKLALTNGTTYDQELFNLPLAKREIASIYRCDLSLIISPFEQDLLLNTFKIDKSLLIWLPFLLNTKNIESFRNGSSFENRVHFMSIGNFNHAPNKRAVELLYTTIWPELSKLLPDAELHIYGAYMPDSLKKLHNPSKNFIIKGWVENLENAYKDYRVCLAPLEFGAGQKGKLLDSMKFGTPNITSSIGAEGMGDSENWNGFICDEPFEFVKNAFFLYQNSNCWHEMQLKGFELLKTAFDKTVYSNNFLDKLHYLINSTHEHRCENFIGSMLVQQTTNASKYFSKWIELKNSKN